MTTEIKAGDTVRRNANAGSFNEVVPGGTYEVVENTLHGLELKGCTGSYIHTCFTKVASALHNKTDEELAAEYRELRRKANEIAVALKERDYKLVYQKGNETLWTPLSIVDTECRYRFTKTVSTTKEI